MYQTLGVAMVAAVLGLSSPVRPQAVEVVLDHPYVVDGTAEQRLDVTWPQGARHTVLFIHGGSLVETGERRSSPPYRDVCRPFVSAQIACATMDYRLAPTHRWPAMPADVASAVAALRRLIGARNGTPDQLVLFGHSSGCQLAAVVGSDPQYLNAVGLAPRHLAGIIPMGCVLDRWDAALRRATPDQIAGRVAVDPSETSRYGTAANVLAANPSFHLGAHTPPTLVIVADEERFMPPILEQGARLVRRLLELQVPAELVVVGGTHMSSIGQLAAADSDVWPHVLRFVRDPRAAGRR